MGLAPWVLTAAALLPVPAAQDAADRLPREFWREIVDGGYAVPEGEDAGFLLFELSKLLSDPDPSCVTSSATPSPRAGSCANA